MIEHGCETGNLFEGRCFACALLEVQKIVFRLRLDETRLAVDERLSRECFWAGA